MSDPKDLEEKSHIKQSLCWNSYLALLLEGADMPPADQPADEEVEENSLDPAPHQGGPSVPAETIAVEPPVLDKVKSYPVVIPYVKGVSEQVRRVMKGYGVKVYFKPTNTLRQILVRPKDKVIRERVVCPVYHISCDNCGESCIGETGRSLKAGFSERGRPGSVSSEVSALTTVCLLTK